MNTKEIKSFLKKQVELFGKNRQVTLPSNEIGIRLLYNIGENHKNLDKLLLLSYLLQLILQES